MLNFLKKYRFLLLLPIILGGLIWLGTRTTKTKAVDCPPGLVYPAQYVESITKKPIFHDGHAMPRLSHWAWPLDVDLKIELAENWNYAIEFGDANATTVANISDPTKVEYRMVQAAKSDPSKYPLQVNIDRFVIPYADYPADAWVRDADGRFVLNGSSKVFSPEAPDNWLRKRAELQADYVRQINKQAPVAIILHGSESDLSVPVNVVTYANQDPRIVAAKGNTTWNDYIAERKSYQELLTVNAVRNVVPDRQAYIYYGSSGYGTHNYGSWDYWGWPYDKMRAISDLPADEIYYNFANNGFKAVAADNKSDMLTQDLNNFGYLIAQGDPLSYNWFSGGWWGLLSDLDLYLGYLKMSFTASSIGGVAGYFDYPGVVAGSGVGGEGYSGFNACLDPNVPFVYANRTQAQPNSIPHWLTQMLHLSQVQAAFSYLEPFMRNGDLLEGDGTNFYSHDQHSYELSTGFLDTRVVARKMRNADKWIVTAWAADGVERDVTVTLREGLTTTVHAIGKGRIYYVTPENASSPVIVDTDPDQPSANAKTLWDNNTLPHS